MDDRAMDASSGRFADVLARAARCLSEDDRRLMRLFYVERWTLREIAAALSVHKSTISRRLAALQSELLAEARASAGAAVRC